MGSEEKLEGRVRHFVISRKVDIVLPVLGAVLGVYFDWTMVEIIIFLIFIWSLIGPIPSRLLAGAALLFLLFTPILHLLKRPERAEEFAVYAYYFIVMAVIRGIIEIRGEGKNDPPVKEKH
ncbi:MAG: hypothetical protein HYV45_03885 [Candidatus Moranbacteria bacterium]|nr:hypothetical protein [Candidatus Moranbacteria bacterium]